MKRLVIVSNRVPTPSKAGTAAAGGLAVAVHAAMRDRGGVWFGWSGNVVEDREHQPKIAKAGKITYATIDLTQEEYEQYYNGFANRTLWPLFHYRMDLTEFNRRNMASYFEVNDLFANTLVALLKPDDVIWVHDYHLIPLAELLRAKGCKHRIGFFLHIPWPALEVLLALPNHSAIVRALCAYDQVGFQTKDDLYAFRQYIMREAGGRADHDGNVSAFNRNLRAEAFPIGIDADRIADYARKSQHSRQTKRMLDSLRGRQLAVGVDRLDYSKGLVERFQAFEQLLDSYPEHRGHVVLLQIAPPSREDVPEYMEIRQQLETTAGHVNGRYAEFDWVPIRYLNRGYGRQALAGFFRISSIGLVTPLRDGMNLVAKEYVAAQNPQDPGVLVLSRFAGAARELEGAIIVNPYNAEAIADALHQALTIPLEERRERWSSMYQQVRKNDVVAWQQRYLDALADVAVAA
ncbi:MAG: alpha,alpha-trehalose-phosphate synthase (UDP-forming) [Alphaproteobacteria bacterium]|nr:alpha,alpha-trehalose-phosphate synthase (UDP-forming) [Alphaproteobacteria bacterium]